MAKIHFVKNQQSLEVKDGSNLMQTLLDSGMAVASSCYGKGICSKCRVQVLSGAENLSRINSLEKLTRTNLSATTNALASDQRLSCQTKIVSGEVTIDTGYW